MTIAPREDKRVSEAVRGFDWKPTLLLVLAMSVYVWIFDVIGFALSSFLFLLSGFLILGERRFLLGAAVAGALVLFLWAVLTQLFGLYLDSGDLYRFLVRQAA